MKDFNKRLGEILKQFEDGVDQADTRAFCGRGSYEENIELYREDAKQAIRTLILEEKLQLLQGIYSLHVGEIHHEIDVEIQDIVAEQELEKRMKVSRK